MKRLALAITILGILVLLFLLNYQSPITLTNRTNPSLLPDNTKVKTSGLVISERQTSEAKILKLDNNLEILCTGCPSYLNRTLIVLGTTEHYQNRTQIRALRIVHKL